MSSSRLTRLLSATALAALVAVPAVPTADAQDTAKPAPRCGVAFTDPAGDNNNASPTSADKDDGDTNLDVLSGFFNYDQAKGAKALTANIHVADLSDRVGPGSSGVVWNFAYDVGTTTKFVRALIDFSGGPYYEYGTYLPPESEENPAIVGRYQYEGTTEGRFIEGKNGVIEIVIPKEAGADAGKTLGNPWASASASRQAAPGPVTQSPSRGVSTIIDTAPDGASPGAGGASFTVAPCGGDQRTGGGGTTGGGASGGGAGGGGGNAGGGSDGGASTSAGAPSSTPGGAGTQVQNVGPAALPVTVLTKRGKRLSKGRSIALRLRTREPLTALAAQLRKGSTVYGKGRLARLKKTGKLKLRVSRKLSKGRYVLDLAGKDARGQHRRVSVAFVVR